MLDGIPGPRKWYVRQEPPASERHHRPTHLVPNHLLEGGDGDGLVVVHIEDGVELGQLKQVMNLLAQIE